MGSPFLYLADERLSVAELSAARLDGHVVEVGDGYIPADAVETRSLRAESLRPLLGEVLAATHLSAAWIHGALAEPPAQHAAQRAVDKRLHHVLMHRLTYRDMCLDPHDITRLGGVWVTSPTRTLADLSRVPDAAHADGARMLAAFAPGLTHRAIDWLNGRGQLPHKAAGLRLLRTLAAGLAAEPDQPKKK